MSYKIIRCLECGGSVLCKNIYTSEPDGFYCKECNQEYFESVNYTGEATGIAFSKVCKEIQSLMGQNPDPLGGNEIKDF